MKIIGLILAFPGVMLAQSAGLCFVFCPLVCQPPAMFLQSFCVLWFANVDNTQLPRFYSRFWCPGAIAVDAFTVNWAGEVHWWVPPAHLVGCVLRHAQHCSAMGSILVPAWKSASFWPLLCPDGQHPSPLS